jgi:nicotinate-nucleotide--dimethylbenzimidazole phosphoribosyltransferase
MSLLEKTLQQISPRDKTAEAAARNRLDQLTMPHWALGRLMDLAVDLAGMTGTNKPDVSRKSVVVMAADHGVASEGVSLYPTEVTMQMVHNFVNGGAGINALAKLNGANVHIVDMGVNGDLSQFMKTDGIDIVHVGNGTGNISAGPAMSKEEAVRCVEAGIRIAIELGKETDMFGTGEMGIGNTTPSSAIVSVMTGEKPSDVTGRGTGIDEKQLQAKIETIEKALGINKADPSDALDVLAKLGGFEIGGLAGLILGAASMRKPVVVDGFISTAGALIAYGLCPTAAEYMIAAHKSVEKGHIAALKKLGKKPLLDLDLRLGEGTGAVLAMNIVEAASRVLSEVATFEEAGVSSV